MTSRLRDMKAKVDPRNRNQPSYHNAGSNLRAEQKPHGIRGRVSGMVHRSNSNDEVTSHQSAPLSSLKDPSTFAPPPKRTPGSIAPPPPPSNVERKVVAAPSKYQDPRGPQIQVEKENSHAQSYLDYQAEQRRLRGEPEPEPEAEEQAPRGPYRVNTTGLEVAHLPPPPGRRDGADGRGPAPPQPPSYDSVAGTRSNTRALPAPPVKPAPAGGAKPNLPPRLPPRTNSMASSASESPSASSTNLLNQGAVSRLGAAGVSVPGLGITKSTTASASPSPPPPPSRQAPTQQTSQVNELQNRFARLKSSSGNDTPSQEASAAPSQGTTWAQKQAALKTASAFQKDPSSVSMADAKSAASTANDFRQRHGEQVASGLSTANRINQKYGVTNKIGGFASSAGFGDGQQRNESQDASPNATGSPGLAVVAAKKKPPPPPPKKKPGLGGAVLSPSPAPGAADGTPPPIPMATRPTF